MFLNILLLLYILRKGKKNYDKEMIQYFYNINLILILILVTYNGQCNTTINTGLNDPNFRNTSISTTATSTITSVRNVQNSLLNFTIISYIILWLWICLIDNINVIYQWFNENKTVFSK